MIVSVKYGGGPVSVKDKHGKQSFRMVHPGHILERQGPLLQVTITQPAKIAAKLQKEGKKIESITVNALIDTGATSSIITDELAKKLKLIQTGYQDVHSVQDKQRRPVYFASIRFHWGRGKEVSVASCPLKGIDCLIGRDILRHWHLTYNGQDGTITICD